MAFVVTIPTGITLIALVRSAVDRVGAAIFAVSLTGLYGVSAAYHRGVPVPSRRTSHEAP